MFLVLRKRKRSSRKSGGRRIKKSCSSSLAAPPNLCRRSQNTAGATRPGHGPSTTRTDSSAPQPEHSTRTLPYWRLWRHHFSFFIIMIIICMYSSLGPMFSSYPGRTTGPQTELQPQRSCSVLLFCSVWLFVAATHRTSHFFWNELFFIPSHFYQHLHFNVCL